MFGTANPVHMVERPVNPGLFSCLLQELIDEIYLTLSCHFGRLGNDVHPITVGVRAFLDFKEPQFHRARCTGRPG